jgi:hypothetical protein
MFTLRGQGSELSLDIGRRSFAKNERLTTDFLAGPLGFEPRQSAPKALDLPLVDGPVSSLSNYD